MPSKILSVRNPETGKYICLVFSTQSIDEVAAYARDARMLMEEGNFKELDAMLIEAKERGAIDDVREDMQEILDCPFLMEDRNGNKYETTMFI